MSYDFSLMKHNNHVLKYYNQSCCILSATSKVQIPERFASAWSQILCASRKQHLIFSIYLPTRCVFLYKTTTACGQKLLYALNHQNYIPYAATRFHNQLIYQNYNLNAFLFVSPPI